ncbi:WD40-like Beta Propeller Repeat [Amycolatopsis xylanica]|uniref:WD40-like Beta Propeller Repeat n=1 Tax=Amycolatopsis xylanica TaxID=589385 RepID=A0A1H2UN24_9PSEU|nr:PD40 domain-containing protein [Amycolatopsis xylanica]SDW57487.1 WD40-like Beta Propeller Repeat [Amycolatopsis xylanica]
MKTRILIAATGVLVLLAAAVVYIGLAGSRDHDASAAGTAGAVTLTPGPRLLFVSTADADRGHLATLEADGVRAVSPVSCTRVYAAAGTGLCLRPEAGLTTYQLVVLDAQLNPKREIPLVGLPNRARVSASGHRAAWTVFVTGDSYNGGRFSTRAGTLDLRTGDLEGTLEDFAVTVDGKPYQAADLNFWGITFTQDDNHFYATMSTGSHRYLVEGDSAARTARTVRDNVECPSLSPDNRRIAYKSAVDGDPAKGWRLSVLDLATGTVTALAETHSVDDQPAWLDNRTIAYALRRDGGHADVWAVPANGSGTPRLLVADAESPSALG